jgi:hypothetical protein
MPNPMSAVAGGVGGGGGGSFPSYTGTFAGLPTATNSGNVAIVTDVGISASFWRDGHTAFDGDVWLPMHDITLASDTPMLTLTGSSPITALLIPIKANIMRKMGRLSFKSLLSQMSLTDAITWQAHYNDGMGTDVQISGVNVQPADAANASSLLLSDTIHNLQSVTTQAGGILNSDGTPTTGDGSSLWIGANEIVLAPFIVSVDTSIDWSLTWVVAFNVITDNVLFVSYEVVLKP